MLVWIVGLSFAAQIAQSVADAVVFEAIEPIRDVGVIAVIAWFLSRFISAAERNILKKTEVDYTTAHAIARLLRISVMITATLVVLQTLGYSISGVLAFGGIGGIAVGFAAKDLLSNFFGGMMIFLDRPFSVGDWIRSPDREIEGTVEHIGWRLTAIRTFDKRPLYIPNSVFTTITVQNPSRMSHRRIYETIGIRYDDVDKLPLIIADVEKMLREHPDIDDSQTLMVNFNAYAPSSLDFFVYTFTHTTVWIEFHAIKQDVLLKIHDIIARHGAEIAYPTSTVHLPDPLLLAQEAEAPATGS
jgi:MscS family membrane protein